MNPLPMRPLLRTALYLLATCCAGALAAGLLPSHSYSGAAWWLANAAAVVFLNPWRGRAWVQLLLVAAGGHAVAQLSLGQPPALVLSFLPGNVLETALASFVLQRLCSTQTFLVSPLEIVKTLGLAGVLPNLLGSALAAAVLSAHGLASFGSACLAWFEGAAICSLATLPLGIYLLEGGGARLWKKVRQPALAVSLPLFLLGIWLALTRMPFAWIYVSGLLVLVTLVNRWAGAAPGVFLATLVIAAMAAAGALPPGLLSESGQEFNLYLPLALALLTPLVLASVLEKLEEQKMEIASSRQQLKELYEKTPAMLHCLDSEGALRFVSDQWLERMGYDRDAVIGRKVFEFMVPEDAKRVQEEQYARFKQQGFVRNYPLRMQARDGASFEVEVSAVLIAGSAGQSPRALSVLNEVTERNSVRKKLEQQTGLLEDVVDAVPYGLAVYDAQRRMRFHNQGFADILKLPADMLKKPNFNFSDLVAYLYARGDYGYQQSQQEMEDRFVAAMKGWARLSLERRQADGSHIEMQAIPLPSGWTVMTYLDITARKSEQRALEDSKERMQLATESSGVGLWEIDLTTGTLRWDAQQYRIYGLEPKDEDLDYNFWTRHVHADDLALAESRFQEAVLGHKMYEVKFRIYWPNGELRYVMARGRSRLNSDGDVVHMVGTNRDVTAEETFADSLRQARNTAHDAAIAKGLFLANMSHELRTPMNAVLGLIQLLGHTALTTNQLDYVEKIDRSAKSLLGLLNDILDFSKIEAGKLDLELRPFAIDQMMRDLALVLSNYVGNKEIDVLFDIDPALPAALLGDPLRLKQVLINLAGNAIKFTQTGQVVVSIQLLELVADNAAGQPQARVAFAVTDSGIGIAPENIPKMFSSFSQAEASTTRKFGGTGLGLAICKLLVELMGGRIALSSELHVGSTFRFELRLPVQDAVAESQAAPALLAAQHHVLVVDDNLVACALMAKSMQGFGWKVDTAHSAEEALGLLRAVPPGAQAPYSLVFVDWQLPTVDGWKTVAQMRRVCDIQGLRPPKFIMVSANGRSALESRSQQEQALVHDFLVKPVTASMLYNAGLEKAAADNSLRRAARNNLQVLAGLRILVVEDNAINQQVAEELLSGQGAEVAIAADGQLAVNALVSGKAPYDIVLMDVQMPVMDGFEATEIIRHTLGLSQLPIIGLTANAMASDREDCLRAGMNEHQGKPFDLAQLVSCIIRLTGHRPPQAQPSSLADPARAAEEQPAPVPASAIIDHVAALSRMGGNERLYMRAAKDLLVVLATVRQSLAEALQAGNRKQCAMLLHTLKGNAATLGITNLAALVAELEVLCKEEVSYASCSGHLDTLDQSIEMAHGALAAVIEGMERQVPDAQQGRAESGQASPGEDAHLRSAIDRLVPLLEAEDFAALEVFAEERAVFARLPVPLLEELETALQDLDWGLGLVVLRRVAGLLSGLSI